MKAGDLVILHEYRVGLVVLINEIGLAFVLSRYGVEVWDADDLQEFNYLKEGRQWRKEKRIKLKR